MRALRTQSSARWIVALAFIGSSASSETRAEQPNERITAGSIEFQGLRDRAPIAFRDMAACATLLKQVRQTKAAELAEQARRDVGFRDLWENPEDFRGALLELRGFCRRMHPSESKLGTGRRLHELWITPPDGDVTPFACIAETLPAGFPINAAKCEPVVFVGFFLKVIAYGSVAGRRGAPLLIGRIERAAGERNADPPDDEEARRLPVRDGYALAVPRDEERFMISVDRNGALALEDEPITREEVAGRLGRLAQQVQLSARALGAPLDPKRGLPAVIIIGSDDEIPCSTILSLIRDCQSSGFVRFSLKSQGLRRAGDRPPETRDAQAHGIEGNDLPAGARTIPIRLGADNRGRIARTEIGELQRLGYDALQAELTSILNDPELPFDRARVAADPRLIFSELARVMELLQRLNVTNIELSQLDKVDAALRP